MTTLTRASLRDCGRTNEVSWLPGRIVRRMLKITEDEQVLRQSLIPTLRTISLLAETRGEQAAILASDPADLRQGMAEVSLRCAKLYRLCREIIRTPAGTKVQALLILQAIGHPEVLEGIEVQE